MKKLKRKSKDSTQSLETKDSRSFAAKIESHLLSSNSFYTLIFIFILQNLLQFWWGAVEEAHHEPNDYKRYTIPIARGAGYMINFNMVLIILFACKFLMTTLRKTPLNILFPFDKAMPLFHMMVGYVVYFAAAIHGIFHLAKLKEPNPWHGGFGQWTMSVVTGFVIFSIFTIMLFTARQKTRTNNFELFYYIHLVGAFIFIVLLVGFHGNFRTVLYTYKWLSAPVFIYAFDRVVRKLREHRGVVNISSTSSPYCGGGVFRLAVPKCFDYKAGQYAEVKVPSVSNHQWHPFTIASAPHEDEMVFFIKVAGDWTEKVQALVKELSLGAEDSLKSMGDQKVNDAFRIHIRGPYGAPAEHVGQYESVVLVAGGVGSTPFSSIIKDAVHYVEERMGVHGDMDSEPSSSRSSSILPLQRANTMTKATIANAGQTFIKKNVAPPPTVDRDDREVYVPFRSIGDRLRIVLHSATAQIVLLWMMIVRLYLIFAAASMKETFLSNSPGFRVATDGYMAADLVLSIGFMIPLLASVLVDYTQLTKYTLLDTVLLGPLSILTVVTTILGLAGVGETNTSTEIWPYLYYFVVFPASFILLGWRYIRIVGQASIIAPTLGYKKKDTRSLDFIWTTPTSADDEWLIGELEPHAFSKHLRLHRFVTREKADVETGEESGIGRFSNNYGRPDWDEVFGTLTMNSRSGSTIGVFFCGPKKMENAVHKALINAMIQSTERGHQYRQLTHSKRMRRGCYVRFVFRAENF